jgi:GNAT superfamily N-acetyltransferase
MKLERVDPAAEPGQVRACHGIYLAGAALDDPGEPPMSFPVFRGWLTYGWSEDPSETWLARDRDGTACGWFRLTLPERENRRYGYLKVVVHPQRRRAGLGRSLLGHATSRALRSGRELLTGEAREGSAGEAFARAVGARQGITEVLRVLWLNRIPPGHLASLRAQAEAASAGYSLLTWEGPVPPGLRQAVAAVNAAEADIPMDPGQEAPVWDAERVRQCGLRVAAQGLRSYSVAAQHHASGELAGITQLDVDPLAPEWGFQGLTAVARPHRGRRLGLRLKVAMLEWLGKAEPQLTRIITGNADTNDHMNSINAELGFEVLGRMGSFELAAAAARGPEAG